MSIAAILRQSLRFIAQVAAPAVSVRAAWYNRRIVGQLATLDDHLLRDMGITRFDLASVLADPRLSDPTEELGLRAKDARRNKRATALEQRSWADMLSKAEATSRPGRRAA